MPPGEREQSDVQAIDDPDLEASFAEIETESAEDVFAAMHAMIEATRRVVV